MVTRRVDFSHLRRQIAELTRAAVADKSDDDRTVLVMNDGDSMGPGLPFSATVEYPDGYRWCRCSIEGEDKRALYRRILAEAAPYGGRLVIAGGLPAEPETEGWWSPKVGP
jgi:hypothetical protein